MKLHSKRVEKMSGVINSLAISVVYNPSLYTLVGELTASMYITVPVTYSRIGLLRS